MRTGLQVQERTFFRRMDINFALVILVLNIIGLINLYSATHGVYITSSSKLFWQQLFWLGAGWSLFLLSLLSTISFLVEPPTFCTDSIFWLWSR